MCLKIKLFCTHQPITAGSAAEEIAVLVPPVMQELYPMELPPFAARNISESVELYNLFAKHGVVLN